MSAGASASANGRLVLVVGPSGAGKDSIINAAKTALDGQAQFVFPPRLITREPDLSEANIYISLADLEAMERRGGCLLAWRAHGCHYAVPKSILDDVNLGAVVIVNVSRSVVQEARRLVAKTNVVLVTADKDVRERRISTRARESASFDRLAREAPGVLELNPSLTIENNGALDHAANTFVAFLKSLA